MEQDGKLRLNACWGGGVETQGERERREREGGGRGILLARPLGSGKEKVQKLVGSRRGTAARKLAGGVRRCGGVDSHSKFKIQI